jgi:hypothetical protein
MKAEVRLSENFVKQAKRLQKRHNSLTEDILRLIEVLVENPLLGIPLGMNCFKIRMAIKSKNKGKSGGARVISHVLVKSEENELGETVVILLYLYDKSELDTVTDKQLTELLKAAISKI